MDSITDNALEVMRADIGIRSSLSSWITHAHEDAVWHFALGVGDDNPLWWDREYALRSNVGRMFAPPTLLYTFAQEVRKPQEGPSQSGVEEWLPGAMGLWYGDRWIWHSRLWVGEEVNVFHELHDVQARGEFERRTVAQTELFTFTAGDGRAIGELYRTILRFGAQSSLAKKQYAHTPLATYSDAQMNGILAQYALESTNRRGAEPRYWEDVKQGDELPGLVKGPLTMTNIVGWLLGWGATQCATNRMLYSWLRVHPAGGLIDARTGIRDSLTAVHLSSELARENGMARQYDFGSQRISAAAHVLTDWCGDDGALIALDAQLRAPNFLGDATWYSAVVIDKNRNDQGNIVTCKISAINQRNEITLTAEGQVALPSRVT